MSVDYVEYSDGRASTAARGPSVLEKRMLQEYSATRQYTRSDSDLNVGLMPVTAGLSYAADSLPTPRASVDDEQHAKRLYGVLIIVGIAVAWVGSSQAAQSIQHGGLKAPSPQRPHLHPQ